MVPQDGGRLVQGPVAATAKKRQDACLTYCGTKEPNSVKLPSQAHKAPWYFGFEVLKSLKMSDNLSDTSRTYYF